MKTTLLKGLSLAGLCLIAMSVATTAKAQPGCPCPQECPPQCQQCPTGCRPNCNPCGVCCLGCKNNDCCLHAIKKWAFCCDYYILPPDYGWNAPTKVPVVRKNVAYYRYYPESWYGTGQANGAQYRAYPMATNPTDTAQLGYTYQQVPYWQPQPRRLPPAPVPSQWHVREAHRNYYGQYQSFYTPIHYHQPAAGTYIMTPMPSAQPCPVQQQSVPQPHDPIPPTPEPSAEPQRLDPVPDAPPPPPEPKSAKKGSSNSSVSMLRRR